MVFALIIIQAELRQKSDRIHSASSSSSNSIETGLVPPGPNTKRINNHELFSRSLNATATAELPDETKRRLTRRTSFQKLHSYEYFLRFTSNSNFFITFFIQIHKLYFPRFHLRIHWKHVICPRKILFDTTILYLQASLELETVFTNLA